MFNEYFFRLLARDRARTRRPRDEHGRIIPDEELGEEMLADPSKPAYLAVMGGDYKPKPRERGHN